MKKNIGYVTCTFCCIITFLLGSCSDEYLNMPPKGLLTNEGFYNTPTQAEQGVVGIYSILRNLHREEFLFLSECRSDNTWVNPTPNGLREYSEIGTFRAGYDLAQINNVWGIWYSVINNANTAIEKIPSIDFEGENDLKNQLMGEAYFLRGWAYFELVRLFGNIPIIDRPMTPAEVAFVVQSPAQEIYNKIVIPDLSKARDLLPYSNQMLTANGKSAATQGRTDRIAAKSMLARAYMTMGGFPVNDAATKDLAQIELKEVIDYSKNNGDKYWAPDAQEWQKQWMSEYNNKYSIFAIQYRSGGTGNNAIFYYSYGVPLSFTNFGLYGNEIYVEKTLMYEYDKVHPGTGLKDQRGIGHSVLTGYNAEGSYPAYSNPTETIVTEDGLTVTVETKSMVYKYLNSLPKRTSLGLTVNLESTMRGGEDWEVNFPVIRYEDVLLMYAEILAEKGITSDAMTIVNDIRSRVGCDKISVSNQAEALKAVKNERRLELFAEGVRWFDIVRWGEWDDKIRSKIERYNTPEGTSLANIKEGRHLYPIPMQQMNIKPGFYNQNTGY